MIYPALIFMQLADLQRYKATPPLISSESICGSQALRKYSLGEGSTVMAPVNIVCPDKLTIGKGVYINPGFLALPYNRTEPE